MAAPSASPTGFTPIDPPRVSVTGDGKLAAIHEAARVTILELPSGEPFAEIGVDPDATASEIGWVGAPGRLIVLSRYEAHSTVHLLDPYGPRTIAEIRLESPMRLFASVGATALVVGPLGAAVLAATETHLTLYPFPTRSIPLAAGAAATQIMVALPGSIEEWDPRSRLPKRRLRLPRVAAITAVGGSERVVWMTTQQEPARIDVIPLVNRGQPRAHDLPEAIAQIAAHPRSDLLAVVGAETGRLYVVDLDGRAGTRVLAPAGIPRIESAALLLGRTASVLVAQALHPIRIVSLVRREGEAVAQEAAEAPSLGGEVADDGVAPSVDGERAAASGEGSDEGAASSASGDDERHVPSSLGGDEDDEPSSLGDEDDERDVPSSLGGDEDDAPSSLGGDEDDEPSSLGDASVARRVPSSLSGDDDTGRSSLGDARDEHEAPSRLAAAPSDARTPRIAGSSPPVKRLRLNDDDSNQRIASSARISEPRDQQDSPPQRPASLASLMKRSTMPQPGGRASSLREDSPQPGGRSSLREDSQPGGRSSLREDSPQPGGRSSLREDSPQAGPRSTLGSGASRLSAASRITGSSARVDRAGAAEPPAAAPAPFRRAAAPPAPGRPASAPAKPAPGGPRPAGSASERFSAWRDLVRQNQRVDPSLAGEPAPSALAEHAPVAAEPASRDAALDEQPRSWRDEVVVWSRAVRAGVLDLPVPAVPAIAGLLARFELAPQLEPVVVLLYGAHLCGERGVAPVEIAGLLDRTWDEALGRGELARRALAIYVESRVLLASVVLRMLDERPPTTGTLVGTPGSVALLGPCVVVAGDEPLATVAARCLRRAGGAILAGDEDADRVALGFEARVYGAAAMLRTVVVDGTSSEPMIAVVEDAALAEQLGVPRLA